MLTSIFRWLRGWLRRPAGLGLAAAVPTLLLGWLYWYEITTQEPRDNSLLQRGELTADDSLRKYGHPAVLRPDMVFIGIDNATLNLDGLWPDEIEASPALKLISQAKGAWNWSREVYALLLDRLVSAGAKLVIFDEVFPNPNVGDEAFRAALDRHRDHVVIASQFVDHMLAAGFEQPTASLIPEPTNDRRVGYASYRPDFDGIIREVSFRTSLAAYYGRAPQPGDVVYSSLLARALGQLGHENLIPADGQPRAFRYSDLQHGAGYTPHPLWEIFSDAAWKQNYQDGAFFKNKIVMVGAAALTLHDVQPTPYGEIPGPALHLEALAAALSRDYLARTRALTNLALIVAAGVLAWAVGMLVRSPLVRLGVLVGVGALFAGVLQWLYNSHGLLPLAFTPLLVFNGGGLIGLIGEYAVERAEKARVRGVLDRLVSKDIVRELLADRDRYAQIVRGQRQPVTVLFSDVRGFTTLSEKAEDPAAFIGQLNEYLGEMVEVVFKHRGTLDKFIGDAVMAVWGSMHTDGIAADACQAVATAVEMRQRLAALNVKWTAEGKQTLAIGIGINHGEVIVGGLGSEKTKMEITVMGDAVNTASRLESLTKEYSLDLLMGESVAHQVNDTFRLRSVDLVKVKGKTRATEVMTVIGPLTDAPSQQREELLAQYEDAILLYRRRDFAAAAICLERCLHIDSDDKLADLYLTRCRELLLEAPAENWDGVKKMTTK